MADISSESIPAASSRRFPVDGLSRSELTAELEAAAADDVDWLNRMASGVNYFVSDEVVEVAKEAYLRFFSTNALYKGYFPGIARFESEIVDFASDIFNGPEARGSVTSGGSESILTAVMSARNRARHTRPTVKQPEMVVPASAHPAFWKAGHYFGLTVKKVPLDAEHQVDLDRYESAITDDAVLLVGSAPSLTLGMVDPIPTMAAWAGERDINFHVDGCVGGWFLPFAEDIGEQFPIFDFRTSGVTTISADLHKFGYGAKGASLLISRDAEIYRHQEFRFGAPERNPDWYVTPSLTGTRPGGAIAAAWAVLRFLGREGYQQVVRDSLAFIRSLQQGIDRVDGLHVLGRPAMTLFAYTSDSLDIFAIAAGLAERGWLVSRDVWPVPTIRFMQSLGHAPLVDRYLADLAEVTDLVRQGSLAAGTGRADYT
jgi:glutamate/tyrosine decarboxylase-like PLP-dependent enzyme